MLGGRVLGEGGGGGHGGGGGEALSATVTEVGTQNSTTTDSDNAWGLTMESWTPAAQVRIEVDSYPAQDLAISEEAYVLGMDPPSVEFTEPEHEAEVFELMFGSFGPSSVQVTADIVVHVVVMCVFEGVFASGPEKAEPPPGEGDGN